MQKIVKILLCFLLPLLLLNGCSTTPGKHQPIEESGAADSKPTELPFKTSIEAPEKLDKEALYNYLAGEISVQRGAWEQAYEHLYLAATETRDPVAASKAARLAWRQDDLPRATRATALWVEYDPNDLSARQLAMLAALRNENLDRAIDQARAVLKIATVKHKDGYLLLSAALATSKDQNKLELIRKLTALYPEDAHAHYALALVATQLKEYPVAQAALQRTLALNPDWDKPYLLQVQIKALQGNEAAAEDTLRQAAEDHPSPALLEAYGRLLMQKKKYPEALKYFRQALQISPDNHELLYVVGVLALQTENWDLARTTWEKLRDNPRYHKEQEAWYFLGQMEELQGNLKQAAENYQRVKRGRLYNDAQIRTAILTGKLGNLAEAHELFNALRLTDPDQAVQIYINEAELLKDLHKPESALQIYNQALSLYPQDPDLLYARGLLAADLGRIQLAEQDFKAALAIRPDDADTLNALGYTLADQTQRFAEALAYIKKALELEPESAAILDSMGWVLYRMGEQQKALEYLRKAAAKLEDPEIKAHLSEVLWMTGNKEEARKLLEEAKHKYPDNLKIKETLQRLK